MEALKDRKCVPCEGTEAPLTEALEDEYLKAVPEWALQREGTHQIDRLFTFDDFNGAMDFVNRVADLAEGQQHHPDITISYNKVLITLYTHAIKGLSQNDFILAARINTLYH